MSDSPILVTGSTRSGTSWVGKMLCLSGEAGYINEPFNQKYQPGWAGEPFPYHTLYINTNNQALYEPVLERILRMRYPAFRNLSRVRSPRDLGRLSRDYSQSYRVPDQRSQAIAERPLRHPLSGVAGAAPRHGSHRDHPASRELREQYQEN